MKFTKIPYLGLGLAAGMLMLDVAPAFALVDEIVVTARRREESLQNVPISVSVLQGGDLEKLNIQDMGDFQDHTPNLFIKPDSLTGSGEPQFTLRGQFQELTTDPNVVLYVAEVPQTTRGISSSFYDIAQVQVLRGPQGTLFGKNSNGGAVVITPNRPTDEFGGWLRGEVGKYDLREFTGVLNLPLIEEKVALRLAGDLTRQNGTVENTLPGYEDYDDQKHESGRASLLVKPTDQIENLTVFDYLHRKEIPTPWIIVSSGNGPLTPYTDQVLQQQLALGHTARRGVTGLGSQGPDGGYVTDAYSSDIWGIANITQYKVNDNITLKNIFGYRHDDAEAPQNLSGVYGYNVPLLGGAYMTLSDTNFHNVLTSRTDEFQVLGTFFEDRLDLIVGGFWRDADEHVTNYGQTQLGFSTPGNPKIDDLRFSSETWAVFGEGTYDLDWLLEGLSFTTGIRQTWDKRDLLQRWFARSFTTYGLPNAFGPDETWPGPAPGWACGLLNVPLVPTADPVNCTNMNGDKYDGLSWNQTLSWRVNDNVNLYGSYKKGYKSGGIGPFLRNIPEKQSFNSESLKIWEIGAKTNGQIGDANWFANATYFNGRYDNLQTGSVTDFSSDFGLPSQSVIVLIIINDVDAKMQGVEFEGGLEYSDWDLSAYYSYLDQTYTKGFLPATGAEFAAGTGLSLDGLEYPGAPKHTAGGALTYHASWLPENLGHLSATGTVSYHGTAPGAPPPVRGAGLPSYVRGDISVEWANMFGQPFDLGFWMRNVTNNIYETACLDSRNSLSYISCKFARQRTFGFSLSYRFGSEADY